MKKFVKFMASPAGRIIRIIAGSAIIAWGLLGMGDSNAYIVAAIGILPILTGLFNICVIGPLLGASLSGSKA